VIEQRTCFRLLLTKCAASMYQYNGNTPNSVSRQSVFHQVASAAAKDQEQDHGEEQAQNTPKIVQQGQVEESRHLEGVPESAVRGPTNACFQWLVDA